MASVDIYRWRRVGRRIEIERCDFLPIKEPDMPLTAKSVEAAKPKKKLYRTLDSEGLYLEVTPAGRKFWRFRYKFNKKENMLPLGRYPEVSLKDARIRRDKERISISEGIDPAAARKETKAVEQGEHLFKFIANEWFGRCSKEWSPKNSKTVRGRIDLHIIPALGEKDITKIVPQDILSLIQKLEQKGTVETARRVRTVCSQIFRYAILMGWAERDPAGDVKGVLPPISKTLKHFAALTDPRQVGELMRAIDGFQGTVVVQAALKVTAYTFLRSHEIRGGLWREIDFERKVWRIPAERMKMNRAHLVPLSRQVINILQDLYALTGDDTLIFPSIRAKSRQLSENTLNVSLRRLGYTKEEMTCHGFRSTASTLLYENGWREEEVELQLAHVQGNRVRASYDHAKHLKKRADMMQWYADYLDKLKSTRT